MRPEYLLVVLLLFLTVLCRSALSEDPLCGTSNKCRCSNFIMDCSNKGLSNIPTKVPKDIKALYMSNNTMTELEQIEFEPDDPDLQTLVLSFNKIKELHYDAFDNLDALKTLQLSHNKIESISDDIFEWNPLKLEVLYLDNNELEFIQHFLFYDLEQLTDLHLQRNRITFIHPHAFLQLKNLRNLRLDGNKLHTFNHKWIEKLQANAFTQLRFDGNPWSCDCAMVSSLNWLRKKKKSGWFHKLLRDNPSSKTIECVKPDSLNGEYLHEQEIETVNKTCDMPRITGISKRSSINATNNVMLQCVYDHDSYPVPTISWTAPSKDIYRLNSAGNFDGIVVHQNGSLLISNVSDIDDGEYTCKASNVVGSFTATTSIKVVKQKTKTKPQNQTISSEAPDSAKTAVVGKSCPDICQCVSRHIDCSGDGITVIEAIPKNIPTDAITLSLASNKLKKLRNLDFAAFKNLEELRLDDNAISHIDANAFSQLIQLTTLTLQRNMLMEIKPGTFAELKSLNVLVLDKNQLTELSKDMFEGLSDLQWLYIRHNHISTIALDAFYYFRSIKFIHLEGNDIEAIHPLPIQNLTEVQGKHQPTIKRIFVDDNNFQCDCKMEHMRSFVKAIEEKDFGDFFGDGIICSNPPEKADMQLVKISQQLKCLEIRDTQLPETSSTYSGILFGGIAVGVVLTIVGAVMYRRYRRRFRRSGKARSYNYSNLNGNDESERTGLTDNMGTSGSEAFV